MEEVIVTQSPESKAVDLLARHDDILDNHHAEGDVSLYPEFTHYLGQDLPLKDPETAEALFRHWAGKENRDELANDAICVLAPMALRFIGIKPELGKEMCNILLDHRNPSVAKNASELVVDWTSKQLELCSTLLAKASARIGRLAIRY